MGLLISLCETLDKVDLHVEFLADCMCGRIGVKNVSRFQFCVVPFIFVDGFGSSL